MDLSPVPLAKQAQGVCVRGASFPCLPSPPYFYFTPSPILGQQWERDLSVCAILSSDWDPQDARWHSMAEWESRHRHIPRVWMVAVTCPPLPLCQSASSLLPGQLSAPAHLCHSASLLCLARGQVGRVPAVVCAPLWAVSWSGCGVGKTLLASILAPQMPEAANYALASPSFLSPLNQSPSELRASECVPSQTTCWFRSISIYKGRTLSLYRWAYQ